MNKYLLYNIEEIEQFIQQFFQKTNGLNSIACILGQSQSRRMAEGRVIRLFPSVLSFTKTRFLFTSGFSRCQMTHNFARTRRFTPLLQKYILRNTSRSYVSSSSLRFEKEEDIQTNETKHESKLSEKERKILEQLKMLKASELDHEKTVKRLRLEIEFLQKKFGGSSQVM